MKRTLLLSMLLFAGCAHTARHYAAPDAAPVERANHKLAIAVTAAHEAVTTSRQAVRAAGTAVQAAEESHATETAQLAAIEPKVENLLRLAPVELRPLAEQVQSGISELQAQQSTTAASLADAKTRQAEAGSSLQTADARLNEADAAKADVAKLTFTYEFNVQALTDRANASETGWAKDSKALAWYRLHWFLGFIVLGAGLLIAALFAFLKFTGRLAISGAAIAAKI